MVADRGPLGALVARQLQDSQRVHAAPLEEAQARARLADGQLAGYIVFPTDFTATALQRRELRPQVHLEGSQPDFSAAVLSALGEAFERSSEQGAPALGAGTGAPLRLQPEVTYLHGGPHLDTLDYFGGAFVGLVVFFLVFVVTSVAFLRERAQGTLERLMASPWASCSACSPAPSSRRCSSFRWW